MHHGAFLDLVGCAGRSLGAELFIGECRRGVPPLNGRGEEIGPPKEVGPAGRMNSCAFLHAYYAS